MSNINVIWNHIFFPSILSQAEKMEFKNMHVLFSLLHILYIHLFEIHEKISHISFLSLPLFPQCTCCTLIQLNCALSLLFLFTCLYFFLTGCGLFQDTKIKEAVDVALLCFSCNQLASETHSFRLWPHSHWNQLQSFSLTSFKAGLGFLKGNAKSSQWSSPKKFKMETIFFLALMQQIYLGCTKIERSHEIFLYSHPSFFLKLHCQFTCMYQIKKKNIFTLN